MPSLFPQPPLPENESKPSLVHILYGSIYTDIVIIQTKTRRMRSILNKNIIRGVGVCFAVISAVHAISWKFTPDRIERRSWKAFWNYGWTGPKNPTESVKKTGPNRIFFKSTIPIQTEPRRRPHKCVVIIKTIKPPIHLNLLTLYV